MELVNQKGFFFYYFLYQVQEGIELAAYESIPGNQRINLFEILGDQFPSEVVNNLQGKIDEIGQQQTQHK